MPPTSVLKMPGASLPGSWVLRQEDLVSPVAEGRREIVVPGPFGGREERPGEVQLHRVKYRRVRYEVA